MSLLLYVPPVLIFIILSVIMYLVSDDPDKNKIGTICLRNVLPSLVVGILVFIIIKYKGQTPFDEPMMKGNYFD